MAKEVKSKDSVMEEQANANLAETVSRVGGASDPPVEGAMSAGLKKLVSLSASRWPRSYRYGCY